MNLLLFFLNRSKLVNLITLMVLVLGLLALMSMNRDLAPPLNFNRITVEVVFPESTAADLESEIAFPIEEKLLNFPGVKQVSSRSTQGSVRINLSFPADFKNTAQPSNEIRQIVESLRPNLPQNIRNITVRENKITSNFQNALLIRGYDLENGQHRLWLEGLKNKISQIRGIAEVQDTSFPKRSVKIDLNETKMKNYEVNSQDVRQLINDFLQFRPLGTIRRGDNYTFIEFEQNVENAFLNDLKELSIYSSPTGFRTTLGQIADITYYHPNQDQWSFEGSKRVFYLNVMKDLNSDIIELDQKVEKVLANANTNPHGISVQSVIGGKSFIERQLGTLKSNGIIGLIIVFIVLISFLSYKSALFTILGVPFSYAATFITMLMLGYGIDILSIVGLILVCGMLVDDALIVCEKYNECLEAGETPNLAAKNTIAELFIPVCGTILTTVVAFLPLLLIPSEMGNMISSVPIVVITALSFSLLESFFILPNHLSHFVKSPSQKQANVWFDKIKNSYQNFLKYLLDWKYSTSLLFLVLTAGLFYVSMDVEKDFDLNISDEIVRVEGEVFDAKSKLDTLNQVQGLYDKLSALDTKKDFETIDLSIGSVWRDREIILNDKVFRIIARVKENNPQPEKVKNKFLEQANEIVKTEKNKYKLLSASKTWSNEDSDKNKYLEFNFYTKNTKVNLDLKSTLEDLPKQIKGIGPLDLGFDNTVRRWVFTPDFAKMAQFGVTKNLIQTAILGKVDENWVREVRIEGKAFPVNLTINGSEIAKNGFDPSKVTVLTQNQRLIAVDKLGNWRLEQSPKSIRHLNGYKVQGARFKIMDEKNRASIVKQSDEFVASIESKFPEYIIRSSGESVEEAENKAWVLKALVACLLGIFFVLAITLNSLTQPLIVSLPIPFAVAGVMWMHKLHDMPLGVFSMIGLIGAIGVSVNGTLIMSDQINLRLVEAKNSLFQCVQIGSASRLRALFLTTITTLAGLFPMAYAIGGDSGFTRPLAFAMAWGILFSSLMTLIFYPSIYLSLATLTQRCQVLFFRTPKSATLELSANIPSALLEKANKEISHSESNVETKEETTAPGFGPAKVQFSSKQRLKKDFKENDSSNARI